MKSLLGALVFAALLPAQMTMSEAWKKEQDERHACGDAVYAASANDDAIKGALTRLEKLKAWCLSDGIRDLKTEDGTPQLYYQRNDILVDEIAGYARLRDSEAVLRCLRELKDSLTAPDSWLKGDRVSFFSHYADSISGNEYVAKLPPSEERDAILAGFRRRDPGRLLASLPYGNGDTEHLSVTDRVAGLSTLWSEAKYNFVNFALVPNLDWDGAYREYLPKVAAASDRYAYYNLLRELWAKLKDSHTDIALPLSLRNSKEVRPPLWTGLIEGKVAVLAEPPAAVAKLGIHKGDVIERIDGVDAVAYGRKTWGNRVSCSTPQDFGMRVYTYMLLRGPRGQAVRLDLKHADGGKQSVRVPRDGALLPVPPPFEFKILPDGTAYFAFNTSGMDLPSQGFAAHLAEIQKAGRLIIDCRQNDGGSSSVGEEILSHLISKTVKVGEWSTRDYRPSFRAWNRQPSTYGDSETVDPVAPYFSGPVVVLIGPRTFSAGEDFVADFKSASRGRIIGMPTGGSTGQPLLFALPGGGMARVCTKHDRMADGTEFVGVGIQPDIRVEPSLADLESGGDSALEAALRALAGK